MTVSIGFWVLRKSVCHRTYLLALPSSGERPKGYESSTDGEMLNDLCLTRKKKHWKCSRNSAGRVSPLQGESRRFESYREHQSFEGVRIILRSMERHFIAYNSTYENCGVLLFV